MIAKLLTLTVAVAITGCATYGQEQHFESDPAIQSAAAVFKAPADRATVYFFRERAWLQPIIGQPIPPAYLAVDGRLVAVAPVGSYLTLSLSSGPHRFSRVMVGGDWLFPLQINQHDLNVELEAGKVYYVGSVNTFGSDPVRSVDASIGRKTIDEARLARQIHNPVTVADFIARVRNADAEAKRKKQSQYGTWQDVTVKAALPSSSQVSSFLEVLAAAAFLAVVLLGAKSTPAPPLNVPQEPPAIVVLQQKSPSPKFQAWQPSTASISDVVHSGGRAEFRDLNTGIRYTIEDGHIRGSDGSRYRAYGSQILSDSGQWYHLVGNTFYSEDARRCNWSGSRIGCR